MRWPSKSILLHRHSPQFVPLKSSTKSRGSRTIAVYAHARDERAYRSTCALAERESRRAGNSAPSISPLSHHEPSAKIMSGRRAATIHFRHWLRQPQTRLRGRRRQRHRQSDRNRNDWPGRELGSLNNAGGLGIDPSFNVQKFPPAMAGYLGPRSKQMICLPY